jgi:hypothetical protein
VFSFQFVTLKIWQVFFLKFAKLVEFSLGKQLDPNFPDLLKEK